MESKVAKKIPTTLTDVKIKRLKPPASGREEHFDALVPGFGVRVTDKGNKSYVVFYRVHGKQTRVTLGSIHELTLAEARDQARGYKISAKSGVDPKAEERKARVEAAQKQLGTFAADSAEFIEEHCRAINKPTTYKERKRQFDKYVIPEIGNLNTVDITRWDMRELVNDIAKNNGPVMANRISGTISAMYNWLREDKEYDGENPAHKIKAPNYKEKGRSRQLMRGTQNPDGDISSLEQDEIRSFWAACAKLGWPFGPYFKFLLLTVQRREETAALKWSDITSGTWTIPEENSKNGKEHFVPLSTAALDIINGMPRLGEYVFTTKGDRPISGFSRAKRRCDNIIAEQRAEDGLNPIGHWTIHDLRRTAVTGMAALGVAPHVVEKIENHVGNEISGVAAVYNRHGYGKEKRKALEDWADFLIKVVTPKAPSNVTRIDDEREARNA